MDNTPAISNYGPLCAVCYITTGPGDTCTWVYVCANGAWREISRMTTPVPLAATTAEIARHFTALGPAWNKRVYVNGRQRSLRKFLPAA